MNLQELSVEELRELHDISTDRKAQEQQQIDEINHEMVRRFNIDVEHIGTRSFDDVKFNVPKNVSWDQDELKTAAGVVKTWGEPVDDYIDTKLSVKESKYSAWPETVRKVFEPARTIKPGKVKVEFK